MNRNKNYVIQLLVLVIGAGATLPSSLQAAIYKCNSEDGEITYNDKPCPVGNEETEIKAVKAPKNPYIPQKHSVKNKNTSGANDIYADKKQVVGGGEGLKADGESTVVNIDDVASLTTEGESEANATAGIENRGGSSKKEKSENNIKLRESKYSNVTPISAKKKYTYSDIK